MFIDEILVQGRIDWLKPLLIAMGITALVRLAAVGLQQVYLTKLEIRLALTESVKFFQHVLRLPVTFFQYRFAGDIVGRVVSTARVARLISGELATTAVSLLTLVFFVAAMLPYDPLLTVVGVAIGGVNLIALRWFSRWRIDQNRAIEQIRGRLSGGVMWAIQIIEIRQGDRGRVRPDGPLDRRPGAGRQRRAAARGLRHDPPGAASVPGDPDHDRRPGAGRPAGRHGKPVDRGPGRLPDAPGQLQPAVPRPFPARVPGAGAAGRPGSDRRRPAPRDRPGARGPAALARRSWRLGELRGEKLPLPRLSGHLELRGVTFGYNRTVEEPLIKDFSLVVRPGQRIALVGESGSGKTTLARLITGLYQPWSGSILHDGKPIDQIPREIFVNSVALVDERIAMFQGTVRDNLTLWDELVSSDRLIQAGLGAAIHRDLLRRRGGYDAAVAEGARNFSGGQRQRLEIARALVRDPSLLVLDEATSALDPKTEAMVDDHLRRRGCACLITAHRLSTIRDCDEIIVLAAGRVVQRGTHEQLMLEPQGQYAQLLANQELPTRECAAAGDPPLGVARSRPRPGRPAEEPAASDPDLAHGGARGGGRARRAHLVRRRERAAPAAIPHRGAVAFQPGRGDGRQPPPAAG